MSLAALSSLWRSQWRGIRWDLILILFSITVLTIGLKVTYYLLHLQETSESRQQLDIDAFMRQHGWSRIGNQSLDVTGIIQAGRYIGGTCSSEIKILIMDPTGDTAGIINDLVHEGEQLFFVHDGVASQDPPQYAPLKQELGRVLQSLQLSLFHSSPYIAIAAPAECQIQAALPWSAL